MNLLGFISVSVAVGLFSAVQDVGSVQIHGLDVPASVRNGTQASVVLDCDYSYDADEAPGLVVSWYFGDRDDPVYQWIPHYSRPQGLGQLRDRLDLHYKADGDKYKMHRALRILTPTTELSGDYTCKVSSLRHEDVRTARMVVFAPATNMSLSSVKQSAGSVNVTCQAEGLFPQPHLRLFRNKVELNDVILERTRREGGVFDLAVYKCFPEQDLSWETIFHCELTIPEVDYREERQLIYYSGTATTATPLTSILSTSQGAALSQGGSGEGRQNQPTTAVSAFTVTVILVYTW